MYRKSKLKLILLLMSIGLILGCQKDTPKDAIPDHENLTMKSNIINENRVINIWTPPAYNNSEQSYPVLYMPDGGIQEDFPHIANTISKLVKQGDIAPVIVVGIENTERRRDLTGPSSVASDAEIAPVSDGAGVFREFIRDELFPEIKKRYRVTQQRAIVGESAAGLFVVETFFLNPEMFDIYLAMDPAIYWNDHDLVKKAPDRLKKMNDRQLKLWFAGSDAEDIFHDTEKLAKILQVDAPSTITWTYLPQPNEHHNTIFRATKETAFKWGLWK
ncbi:alpha/beta hydrolase [candidate division KSB1 bacterium]|nr:alpha/beta hydrolase [candidate division KSB1 bacterium]